MPSASLRIWQTTRAATLDEIEAAHSSIGGTGRGRRYATQQVNHAYVVLLSGQFQGFCRDLHTECVKALVSTLPAPVQPLTEDSLLLDRRMDRGNVTPANLGSDFGRFDIQFWPTLYQADQRSARRRFSLEEMNGWRNAIAHQDFSRLSGTVQLQQVRRWRSACDALSIAFDDTMKRRLLALTGAAPW